MLRTGFVSVGWFGFGSLRLVRTTKNGGAPDKQASLFSLFFIATRDIFNITKRKRKRACLPSQSKSQDMDVFFYYLFLFCFTFFIFFIFDVNEN